MVEHQKGTDGNFADTKTSWEYDADGRLTKETRDEGNDATQNGGDYVDTFGFDLAGNRVKKEHDAVGTTNDETVTSTYNANDQLKTEDSTVNANDKTLSYDANGSLTSETTAAATIKYRWDLRNRMTGVDANGDGDYTDSTDATYTYDSNGVRVSETTNGSTKYFLNDSRNPTGYTKAIEESSTAGGTPTRSFVLGNSVIGQSDATNGIRYLVTDGHGSTRALTNTSGAITDRYDYDAYGQAIGFTASTAITPWLFAGDGVYDASTGWTYQLARWRDGDRFVSFDSFEADPSSPASLHKYLYASANPIYAIDPSGHLSAAEVLTVTGIALNVINFISHVNSGVRHLYHGETNAGEQDMVLAAIDLLTLGLPFYGPGSRVVVGVGSAVRTFSRIGLNVAAIWGYLTTLFNVSGAGTGGGGSSSSGGGTGSSSSTGSRTGQWEPEDQSSWSESARKYQEQITGRSGQSYNLNGVKFDGFDNANLLDAKDHYSWMLDSSGRFMPWFNSNQWTDLAIRQINASGGRPIIWHFAEKEAADAVRPLVQRYGVQVVNTPRAF